MHTCNTVIPQGWWFALITGTSGAHETSFAVFRITPGQKGPVFSAPVTIRITSYISILFLVSKTIFHIIASKTIVWVCEPTTSMFDVKMRRRKRRRSSPCLFVLYFPSRLVSMLGLLFFSNFIILELWLSVQLLSQFRVFPSSESRGRIVTN